MNPRLAAPLATIVGACLLAGACGGLASPSPSPRVDQATPSPSVTPSAAPPTARPTPSPRPSPSATPAATPVTSLAPPPSSVGPPTIEAFWTAAANAVEVAGRLRVRVIGPAPGELRYQPDRSATAIDGLVVFACIDGRAYDGQSGFTELPGTWTCGPEALVRGFRQAGQPLDAWNAALPPDQGIEETIALETDGTWRWGYRARSPFAGGEVLTTVVLDPATGQIRSASRTDPTGDATYGLSYTDPFPDIALP